jgi:superfamily II DNA/RNA helicase
MTFEELGLREEVLKSLKELGFEAPTPIQEQAIPHLMKDDCDFVGLAQTGTGKTAAFGLPLINAIDPKSNRPQGLDYLSYKGTLFADYKRFRSVFKIPQVQCSLSIWWC